ncbi:Calpain-1 catalytic subunit [Bulinus truncatus]|nr:Calpain-1 catalytic subunit [Bulinus truncatus]
MAQSYLSSQQKVGSSGRLGSQSNLVDGGSQQNLTGTLNRTQVERRPAQFISARSRLESDNSFDGRTSPGGLKRTAKSQERLNVSSNSLSGSRSNLVQARSIPNLKQRADDSRDDISPLPQQVNSPNYSNISNYSSNNNNDFGIKGPARDRNSQNSTSSHSSYSSQGTQGIAIANPMPRSSSTSSNISAVDNKLHEFEKVRVDYLRRGKLYEDGVFLPSISSIYFSREPPVPIEWIRAKDVARMNRQAPRFMLDINRFEVTFGKLGDFWLVSAISCLTDPDHRNLFDRVVPPGQSFQENWYSGVFRFNFWHFGHWKQILVDDLLPISRGQLVFIHSTQSNEFWGALLEKAYAKLYGSYESLKGGNLMDALTDLTGGLTEHYDIKGALPNLPSNIINILYKSLDRFSLIACSIEGRAETLLGNGLMTAHTYCVTDLRRILSGKLPVTLIRIRNPSGENENWKGKWSERSQEWQQISPDNRAHLGLILRDDGEFWMEFEDFLANFDTLDVCHFSSDTPMDVQKRWHSLEFHGRWMDNFNAGGRPVLENTHWTNPQYLLKLSEIDEDEENVCSVIVQLMQKDRRKIKQKGEIFSYIGFFVYQYEKGYSLPLKKEFFDHHQEIANSGAFINSRQITKRLTLPPGEYILVPCTWDANETADYYLRFFFERPNVVEYCDEKAEKLDDDIFQAPPENKSVEENFRNFFFRVSGEIMEVDCFYLQEVINDNLKKDPILQEISLEACKSLLNLMDEDRSARLGFVEFQSVWNLIRNCKKTFQLLDKDNTGLIETKDLREAINQLGYKVPNKILASLIFQSANKSGKIYLDNFIILMCHLIKSFKNFKDYQINGGGTLTLEQWLCRCLV